MRMKTKTKTKKDFFALFGGKKFIIAAHRGDSGEYPENSLESFQAAAKLDVDMIETDLHLTKDHHLVVFHDDSVDRTTDGTGKIKDLTLDELKELNIGYNFTKDGGKTFPFRNKPLRILTIEELFQSFPNIVFNFDLKDNDPNAAVKLSELIKEYNFAKKVVVASFHPHIIEKFRKLSPNVITAAHPKEIRSTLLLQKTKLWRFKKNFPFDVYEMPPMYNQRQLVTPQFIKNVHRKNLPILLWTINERHDMEKYIKMGVDGIFTDYPSLLLNIYKEIFR